MFCLIKVNSDVLSNRCCAYLWISLKYDDPPALVAGGEEVAILVELDTGDDIGLGDVVVQGALHLREAPLHLARR